MLNSPPPKSAHKYHANNGNRALLKIAQYRSIFTTINSNGDKHELVVKGKDGSQVAWPVVMTGKSGAINAVGIKSYHPPKVDGQNEHATVAVFGDLYMAHNGRPSAADKAVAAAFAPKQEAEPEQKKDEAKPEEKLVEAARPPEATGEQQKKGKGGRQHSAA